MHINFNIIIIPPFFPMDLCRWSIEWKQPAKLRKLFLNLSAKLTSLRLGYKLKWRICGPSWHRPVKLHNRKGKKSPFNQQSGCSHIQHHWQSVELNSHDKILGSSSWILLESTCYQSVMCLWGLAGCLDRPCQGLLTPEPLNTGWTQVMAAQVEFQYSFLPSTPSHFRLVSCKLSLSHPWAIWTWVEKSQPCSEAECSSTKG